MAAALLQSSPELSIHSPFIYVNGTKVSNSPSSSCPPSSNFLGRLAWIQSLHGPNVELTFTIERVRSGLDIIYCAFLDAGDGIREQILWAKKWRKSTSSQYTISMDIEDLDIPREERGKGFVGKLKAIQGNRVYILFDGGDKTKNTLTELGCVIFSHERAASDTIYEPKMEVAVLSAGRPASARGEWKHALPTSKPGKLLDNFYTTRQQGTENFHFAEEMTVLREMPDFIGRDQGDIQSVKNFGLQLSLPSNHAAKVAVIAHAGGKDEACAAQVVPLLHMEKTAFGIAVSRFETKQAV